LSAAADCPFHVQDTVDLFGSRLSVCGATRIRLDPGRAKFVVAFAPAFGTGSMAGRERRRLVEEEQLAVAVRREDLPLPTPERQGACDPALEAPGCDDPLFVVVQDAAIAHPRATGFDGVEFPVRIDPV